MNKPMIKLAGLALAGVLLSPAAAFADANVTATTGGTTVVDGGSGSLGQAVSISGTGCINPSNSQPGYMGEFVSMLGDPETSAGWQPMEVLADASGGFQIDVVIPTDNGIGTFYSRWYCSASPVTDIGSGSMLWVGPMISMDIQPVAPSGMRSAKVATVKVSKKASASSVRTVAPTATASASGPVSFHVDPDALPAVDRMGIPGAQAAKLKVKVDAAAGQLARLDALLSRKAVAKPTNEEYVQAAFLVLTNKLPAAKVIKPYIARLDAGDLKVAVVEDIALTAHNAAWWIRNA